MDNHHVENTMNQFRDNPKAVTLGNDFEDRVFAKIKKKKFQRKVTASVALGLVVVAFVFILHSFIFNKAETPTIMAHPGTTPREEVHVMEDVIFASSDSGTSYAIEQVAYYDDDSTI